MKLVKKTVDYWCSAITRDHYLGQGIRIAVLDTGISEHPDFGRRIVDFRDFTENLKKPGDTNGHGTHVAGILAGDGTASSGTYAGMAPRSELIIGKVLNREGNGDVDIILKGIQWIISMRRKQNIRIVNISVGTQPDLCDRQKQYFLEAVEELWDLGMTVIVSAGNFGPGAGTVSVPGSSRKVITVGVPDSPLPAVSCRRKHLNYSGRGPTEECIVKPDVYAPGTGIISCNSRYSLPGEHPYTIKSGTSMAAPVVAGAVACLLSRYPDMSNVEVKLKLRQSCSAFPGTEAGWGMLNVRQLMQA